MVSTFFTVVLISNFLGSEGQGTAGLINFGVLVIVAISSFIGGGALVYIIPRSTKGDTVWPSVLWATIVALFFLTFFNVFHILPQEFVLHICILGWLQSLFSYLAHVSLAFEKSKAYNTGISLQAASQALALLILFAVFDFVSPWAIIIAMYISFGLTLLVFIFFNLFYLTETQHIGWKATAREQWRLGKYSQGGYILHLLNQRLNTVLLENLLTYGRAMAGVYSIAMYAAEVVWTVAKSLSVQQYARIANSTDANEHHIITGKYVRISLTIALIAAAAIVIVPSSVYLWFFDVDAPLLKTVLLWLVPGIIANSCSVIFTHYFSGTGQYVQNVYAAGSALIIGTSCGIPLISRIGVEGAAMTASIAFIVQLSYLAARYAKELRKFKQRI
jgi:O-antigen/teichoic acid export membrane protein